MVCGIGSQVYSKFFPPLILIKSDDILLGENSRRTGEYWIGGGVAQSWTSDK